MSAPNPMKAVLATGGALLTLWVASFALSYVSLGAWALPVALAIAAAKALFVVLVFMELLRESLSIKMTILAAVALLLTLIALMVADIATRSPPPLRVAIVGFEAQRPSAFFRPAMRTVDHAGSTRTRAASDASMDVFGAGGTRRTPPGRWSYG